MNLLHSLLEKWESSGLTDDQISPLYYDDGHKESCVACVLQLLPLVVGLKYTKKAVLGVLSDFLSPLSCWTRIYPTFANSVDPDQLASEEANWSALFAIKYVKLYKQSGSSWLEIRSGWHLNLFSMTRVNITIKEIWAKLLQSTIITLFQKK